MDLEELKKRIKASDIDCKSLERNILISYSSFLTANCSITCQPGCSVNSSGKNSKPCGIALSCAEGCAASSCTSKCFYGCSGGKTIGLF